MSENFPAGVGDPLLTQALVHGSDEPTVRACWIYFLVYRNMLDLFLPCFIHIFLDKIIGF